MDQILAVEVEIASPDDFLKIKETLTRIGIANNKSNTLYQTAHILSKRGKYYIVHFKEMFVLDGRENSLDDFDIERRNAIAILLQDWKLLKLVNPLDKNLYLNAIKNLKIVSYKDKRNWVLKPKYTIGKKTFKSED